MAERASRNAMIRYFISVVYLVFCFQEMKYRRKYYLTFGFNTYLTLIEMGGRKACEPDRERCGVRAGL